MDSQAAISNLTEAEQDELLLLLESVEQEAAASEVERARNNERLALQADFSAFVKAAWPILEPGNELSWSWHYDLMAEYLTLAADKKLRRLIINIPPRTLKSILVSVMFPVWVWTRTPSASFVSSSYADKLATEHSVKRRRLIESDWFKRIWGDRIWLQKDQNEKTKFQNNYQAQMIATSVGGTATGMGGNFLLVDDGLKPDEIASEPAITSLHTWFDNTWRSRLNNPAEDVMIIIEQRTGELDLTGHCVEGDKLLVNAGEKPEWTHLNLPAEADEEAVDKTTMMQKFVFPLSGRIKVRPLGDVLQPDRFPPEVIAAWKVRRLIWATQYQGRPSPLGGNMIKRSEVMYYGGRDPDTGDLDEGLPAKFDFILVSVDAAFKDLKTSDYVCVGTIGVVGRKRYIIEVVNKHLDSKATETEAKRQRTKYASNVVIIEDKANGPAIIKEMRRSVPGVVAIEPEGGKISRFFAVCGEWQAGDWYVDRNAAWCEPFVDNITKFPGVKNDDQSDMMSQAGIYLQKQSFVYGLTDYYKQKDAEMKRKQNERKNRPANTQLNEIIETKVEHSQMAKPEVDDKTPRCPNDECRSTFLQRAPGGGLRCGQCGLQFGRQVIGLPATTDFGMLRK